MTDAAETAQAHGIEVGFTKIRDDNGAFWMMVQLKDKANDANTIRILADDKALTGCILAFVQARKALKSRKTPIYDPRTGEVLQ